MPFSILPAGTLPGQRTIAGTRKPPSSAVPLPPAKGVCPPSGQVKFSAPLSVVKTTMVLSSSPLVLRWSITEPTMSSSWAMPASCSLQPFVELRIASYLSERWVMTCIRVGFSQTKNGFLSVLRLVDEGQRLVADLLVDGLHPLRIERARVLDLLLADLAPARLDGRIVGVGRPGMDHVARPDDVQQILRIVRVRRVLHRVEVVEVAEELVEPVHRRQELVEVAEVVLAELARSRSPCPSAPGRWSPPRAGMPIGAPAWPTVVMPVRIGISPVMKLARPAVQLASA